MFRALLVIGLWSLIFPLQEAHAITRFVRVTPQYLKENPDFIQITHVDRGKQAEFELRLRPSKPERVATGLHLKKREEDQEVFVTGDTLCDKEMRVRFVIPMKSVRVAVFSIDVGGHTLGANATEPGGNGGTVYEIELQDFVSPPAQEASAQAGDAEPLATPGTRAFVVCDAKASDDELNRIKQTLQELGVPLEVQRTERKGAGILIEFLLGSGTTNESIDRIVDEAKSLTRQMPAKSGPILCRFVAHGGGEARPAVGAYLDEKGRRVSAGGELPPLSPKEVIARGPELMDANPHKEVTVRFNVKAIGSVSSRLADGSLHQVTHLHPSDSVGSFGFTVPLAPQFIEQSGIKDVANYFVGRTVTIRGYVTGTAIRRNDSTTGWAYHIELKSLDKLLSVTTDDEAPLVPHGEYSGTSEATDADRKFTPAAHSPVTDVKPHENPTHAAARYASAGMLRKPNLPPVTRNNAKCFVLLDEQRLSQSLEDERYWDSLRAMFTHDDRVTVHFRVSTTSGRDVPVKALSVRIKKELASADAFIVCVDHEARKDGVSWEQRVVELSQMQQTLSREMKSPDGLLWVGFDPANVVSWRALTDQQKYREAAQVIEQFFAENPKFEDEEVLAAASMHFDAAQNRALDGNIDAALRHIKAARHNRPTGDGLLWSEYLDGTEAFLRNDRAALLVALKKVCAGGPINRTNAAILDKLSVHFGETYEQAYLAWRNDAPAK